VDFSIVKDTKVGMLGEAGSVQFRAEFFNILNHTNFSVPNGTVWSSSGKTPTSVPSGQIGVTPGVIPFSTVGAIGNTVTNSRQIQFALKLLF
jgi:hypothetical protein